MQEPLGNLEQEAIPMAMATSFEPVKEFYNQIKNEKIQKGCKCLIYYAD